MFVFVSVCANGVVPFVANFFVVRTQSRDVQMFDVATAEVKNTLRGHQASVNCCCVHPSLPMAFTGADDCSILAWVPQTRTAATAAATTAGMQPRPPRPRRPRVNGRVIDAKCEFPVT